MHTLMPRPRSAQHVKSSKLPWAGWWGSMLPGYVDCVPRFSQGAWERETSRETEKSNTKKKQMRS